MTPTQPNLVSLNYEDIEQRVRAFVEREVRNGACAQCMATAMVGIAVDVSFDGGFTETVHNTLRRCCATLDQCEAEAALH
jgi:hypothetical protein